MQMQSYKLFLKTSPYFTIKKFFLSQKANKLLTFCPNAEGKAYLISEKDGRLRKFNGEGRDE